MNGESKELSMKDFLEDIDNSFKPVRSGDILKGKVISIHDDGVIVNINYMYDGLIPKSEISLDKEFDIYEKVIIGEDINVYVIKTNDGEGHVLLSKKIADSIVVWDDLEKIYKNSNVIEVTVSEVVKGGLVCYFKGIRTFIPASQLSLSFVQDLSVYIGKTLQVRIIELDKEKKKIVLSKRVIDEENKKFFEENLLNTLKVGEIRNGKISRLAKFGAFVDLGGIDGLIHINDLSWRRTIKPEDVVSVGDEVQVYILSLDKENKRIGLSLKKTIDDPWNTINNNIKVGDIVSGNVVKITNFGAFVEIYEGIEGLVHLNEITEENITKVEDKIKIGDKVKVKILDINSENKRISLSIKDAIEKNKEYEKYNDNDEVTLGDLLSEKLKNFKFN
ncbi:30S ribosomal protein S1 [Clostridium sp.]|uniref:30S ribosomal protein S1 n=1 Tax=Clostridium sp. TaxID=1506 RepID=UPI002FC941C6